MRNVSSCPNAARTQYVEVLQRRAARRQLLYVRVADGAVGGEEELPQSGQAAGELLEAAGAALQGGTPAQVQLLQRPEPPQNVKL